MSKFVAYTDYTREMKLRNGTVELIHHCGKCMTIKPFAGADCSYCHTKKEKRDASLHRLKAMREDRGEDLI